MSNKNIKYLLIVIIIAFTALLVYNFRDYWSKADQQIELTANKLKPKAFERTFKEISFEETALADSLNKHLNAGPFYIKTNSDQIFIMSLSDVNIKRFNENGDLLNVIGNGKGKGPGEFLHPNSFYIRDNDIWVTDTRLMKVMRFDVGGKFKNSFLVKYHPIRIHGFADNLLIKTIASDYIIKRLDYEGNKLAEFGNLIENQLQNALSVGGYIKTFNDITIFAPHIASLLYYYKADTLFKMARRPDGQNFKSSQKRDTGEGKMVMAPEAKVEARTLFKMDNKLFIGEIIKKNSSTKNKSNKKTVIDCYEVSSGKYKYSINPPLLTRNFRIFGNTLIARDDNQDIIRTFKFDRSHLN